MTPVLLTILATAAALAIVVTIGLLWRDARKVAGHELVDPVLIKALRQMDTSSEARRYLEGRYVVPPRWNETGEAVE